MGHECRWCGQPILDTECLRDSFAVSLDYHRYCVHEMYADLRPEDCDPAHAD